MNLMQLFNNIQKNSIARLMIYLWPKESLSLRFRFVAAILSLVISKFAGLAVPLYFKDAVNALSPDQPAELIVIPVYFLLAYGIYRILSVFFSEIRIAIFAPVENQAMRRISVELFSHLHSLSLRFHLERRTGGLTRTVERGVKAIENFLWFSVNAFVPAFFELLIVVGALWYLYDYRYAGLAFIFILIYIVFTIRYTEWRTKVQRELNIVDTSASGRSVDALLNYETVKYFNNENLEIHRYEQLSKQYEQLAVKSKRLMSYMNFGQGTIISVGLTAIMYLAAWDVVHKNLTVGDFVLVNTYLFQAFLPIGFLGFAYRETKQAVIDMEGMFTLLDEEPEIQDDPHAKDYKFQGGKIEFKDVHFSYNPSREIIKGVSFTVEPGKTLALVGKSGAGKSTIGRILFRFYDISKGSVFIDGQDIEGLTQLSVRKAIGIVPQDTVLFNDTIFYNIMYGQPDATLEEVIEVAKLAQIHDFIEKLPDGYNTLVGERGLKLSGGEKQRVAIARTLLKKPKIFIFDEATSALDTHTEKEIQECLTSISSHHTTITIAHRLSTIVHADEILLLSDGEIVERGSHKNLLAQHGLYAEMWKRQQFEEKLHELIKS